MKIFTPRTIARCIMNAISPQPEEAAEFRRYEFGCGNRCACSIDGGPAQVIVDGLLVSCVCDEASHD
jgi:hypothetical protein